MKQGPVTAAPAQKAAARTRREWSVRPSVRLDACHDVISPDGVIYGTYPGAAQARAIRATRQAEEDRKARVVTRPCMCCREPFDSEGPHNRMCHICRRRGSDPLEPQRPYITRSA
jgi:hypothetical protein